MAEYWTGKKWVGDDYLSEAKKRYETLINEI